MISVIIPVYNDEKNIRECLDSVLHQSYADFEVICVDDGSTDHSLNILREYEIQNTNLRVIALGQNLSANIARKRGAKAARGDYIWFVDADDTIEADACEILAYEMEQDPVDILHFGTKVYSSVFADTEKESETEVFFNRLLTEKIRGSFVNKMCFISREYNSNLWNKLFTIELVKQALPYIEEIPLPRAQDVYLYFILSSLASSYRGIENKLYNYHYGYGLDGHDRYSAQQFKLYCKMADAADAGARYAERRNIGYLIKAARLFRLSVLQHCIGMYDRIEPTRRAEGLEIIIEAFGAASVASAFADLYYPDNMKIVSYVRDSMSRFSIKKEIRTIGTFYFRLDNGGTERVMASLAGIWVSMGYRVVIFTDRPPCEDDYDLPENMERVVLPDSVQAEDNYFERAEILQKNLIEKRLI